MSKNNVFVRFIVICGDIEVDKTTQHVQSAKHRFSVLLVICNMILCNYKISSKNTLNVDFTIKN